MVWYIIVYHTHSGVDVDGVGGERDIMCGEQSIASLWAGVHDAFLCDAWFTNTYLCLSCGHFRTVYVDKKFTHDS